jgi:hypothetical protein
MTYALSLVKGIPKEREKTLALLLKLKEDTLSREQFRTKTGTSLEEVYISFGWPDFILLMKSANIELLKTAIVELRELVDNNGDNIETSTIICTTQRELEDKKKEWGKMVD